MTAPLRWAVAAVFRMLFGPPDHSTVSIEPDEGARDLLHRYVNLIPTPFPARPCAGRLRFNLD
ncbi:hypothetical protein [Azospirillum doebereinerae]|uniref:Uncharacterized protein n=1 Tax=Azospirillum doebereinerae TaxID=92933 RepID=A0A433JDE3_9PROT|nr:hypothetical protein [Azospirillum doebereinerae]RUQ74928.1 hypothetical protein EJ913_03395 [Azospirillum doebereinerae]